MPVSATIKENTEHTTQILSRVNKELNSAMNDDSVIAAWIDSANNANKENNQQTWG